MNDRRCATCGPGGSEGCFNGQFCLIEVSLRAYNWFPTPLDGGVDQYIPVDWRLTTVGFQVDGCGNGGAEAAFGIMHGAMLQSGCSPTGNDCWLLPER
jgi:hypothetical protein